MTYWYHDHMGQLHTLSQDAIDHMDAHTTYKEQPMYPSTLERTALKLALDATVEAAQHAKSIHCTCVKDEGRADTLRGHYHVLAVASRRCEGG